MVGSYHFFFLFLRSYHFFFKKNLLLTSVAAQAVVLGKKILIQILIDAYSLDFSSSANLSLSR